MRFQTERWTVNLYFFFSGNSVFWECKRVWANTRKAKAKKPVGQQCVSHIFLHTLESSTTSNIQPSARWDMRIRTIKSYGKTWRIWITISQIRGRFSRNFESLESLIRPFLPFNMRCKYWLITNLFLVWARLFSLMFYSTNVWWWNRWSFSLHGSTTLLSLDVSFRHLRNRSASFTV